MKISTKGRYALRLMIDIAEQSNGNYISIKDIAMRQDISDKYLEQIVSALCKFGFLKSARGARGGYKLSRPPSEYTVGSILRVTEGDLAPVACLMDDADKCPRSDDCPTVSFWAGLDRVIQEYVESVTLEDLLKQKKNER